MSLTKKNSLRFILFAVLVTVIPILIASGTNGATSSKDVGRGDGDVVLPGGPLGPTGPSDSHMDCTKSQEKYMSKEECCENAWDDWNDQCQDLAGSAGGAAGSGTGWGCSAAGGHGGACSVAGYGVGTAVKEWLSSECRESTSTGKNNYCG